MLRCRNFGMFETLTDHLFGDVKQGLGSGWFVYIEEKFPGLRVGTVRKSSALRWKRSFRRGRKETRKMGFPEEQLMKAFQGREIN